VSDCPLENIDDDKSRTAVNDDGTCDEPMTRETMEIFVHDLTVEHNPEIQRATMRRILASDAVLRAQHKTGQAKIQELAVRIESLSTQLSVLRASDAGYAEAQRDNLAVRMQLADQVADLTVKLVESEAKWPRPTGVGMN
jgi:hypothetical protein